MLHAHQHNLNDSRVWLPSSNTQYSNNMCMPKNAHRLVFGCLSLSFVRFCAILWIDVDFIASWNDSIVTYKLIKKKIVQIWEECACCPTSAYVYVTVVSVVQNELNFDSSNKLQFATFMLWDKQNAYRKLLTEKSPAHQRSECKIWTWQQQQQTFTELP